jgi:hypothetical protein
MAHNLMSRPFERRDSLTAAIAMMAMTAGAIP